MRHPAKDLRDDAGSVADLADARLRAARRYGWASVGQILDTLRRHKLSPYKAFFYFKGLDLQAVRSGAFKLHLVENKLYDLTKDPAESTDLSAQQPAIIKQLQAHATAMRADLGDGACGPGCRPADTFSNPKPLIPPDEKPRTASVP
jgi:arylsulfatase A